MELNTNKFALAGTILMGVWYIICATIVSVMPKIAATLFSWMTHLLNVEGAVSFPEVIYGFIEVIILAYVTAYAFAWLYNTLLKTT
ncbi:MAG: hypothetical protein HYT27_02425 [Parcubacteria group bacterium]|nr:hypothetical protein [Parcubacteria group bacterium]